MKKILVTLAVVCAALVAATTAFGAQQLMITGGGQTHDGASYGFNAKDDNSGTFNYVGPTTQAVTINGTLVPAGTSFHGLCQGYYMTNFISAVQARLFADCRGDFFLGGGPPLRTTVHLQAHVTDNGEPGTDDRDCIAWGLNRSPGLSKPGLFVWECGRVDAGNIQMH